MTTEIIINIKDKKNPPVLKFPARCVSCGKQQETTMKISLNMGVQKRSKPVMMENVVPMCNACAEKERSVTKVTLVPFLIAGSLIGIVVFVIVTLISPEGTTSQTISLPFVLGGAAGLLAGIISGTVVEFVAKLLFTPFYGKLLAKRPLTIFGVFNDSEDVIGLSFRFGDNKKSLKLVFENQDIAREFINLNPSGENMKSDFDTLMQARNLDAIMVFGNAEHNPPMTYLTGGGHVSHATLIKKRGQAAILFHGDMERDEAAKSGLKLISYSNYDGVSLYKQANGDSQLAAAMRAELMLKDANVTSGRVGVYGTYDLSAVFGMLMNVRKMLPNIEFVGEAREDSIFMRAMETKDENEIARIRKMGKVTTSVVAKVRDYLTSCNVRDDEVLLNEDGSLLTVGDVHSKIRLWVAEQGAELPSGFIFAIGRDAGVPHSAGTPTDLMKLGQTIVFDIYPAEAGGGYYYDFTRTWSLGYATPEAQELYDQVKEIFDTLNDNFDLNTPFANYNIMTCEYFESKGHQSPLHTSAPVEGYVHSLGHGVGLNIHERPFSGLTAGDDQRLAPGVVITSEPGLYYPEKSMGFRIEDTLWVRPDGKMETLAEYPYDFVLPMKNWKK